MAELTDEELVESGKRSVSGRSTVCQSVLVATGDLMGKQVRAYWACYGGSKAHTVHFGADGSEWWQDSHSGDWRSELKNLKDPYYGGAGV
jgi:hypothetical protein